MYRYSLMLCLMSRVYSAVTMQRHIYTHQISRMARTDSPLSQVGRPYTHLGESPGMSNTFSKAQAEHSSYVTKDSMASKSAEKLGKASPIYTDLANFPKITPESYMAFTPMSIHAHDYKRPRNIDSIPPYPSSDVFSGFSVDKFKYPNNLMNDVFYGYDNDDDDVRTSGRNSYDSYASMFYHNPYEYDHKSIDMEKAKDKRYADLSEKVIPVHEYIENDTFVTPLYEASTAPYDNPIGGNGPFFSFVLNDYFDRNHEEDTLSFKGLGADWGKDFDHESYKPLEDIRRERRLEHYFTPIVQWFTTARPINLDHSRNHVSSAPEGYMSLPKHTVSEDSLNDDKFDNHDMGEDKHSYHGMSGGTGERKYEGFKDFLDSFANKFGSAENQGDSNYKHATNKDKGEKKNGFHRVYHKDEFLEDNAFFDHSNNSAKAADKASTKFHFGGSEAILRSQALAAAREAANGNREYKKGEVDVRHDNVNNSIGAFNMLNNNFDKYINVAKQAAKSNNADYVDHFLL